MDISPLSSRLCSQPTDDKSSADEDNDASVRRAFSKWGRGEAAARGGEGAYIKQPNSERASTFSGKRNVRGREKSMGNFGTDRYILGAKIQSHLTLSFMQPSPCSSKSKPTYTHAPHHLMKIQGDFQALTPQHQLRQGIDSLLRPDIKDKCLQNSCTETEAC